MRKYTREVCTVGELRKVLADNPALPDNAYVWCTDPRSGHEARLVANIAVDDVTTPDEGFPQEKGLCLDMEGDV